MTFTCNKCPAAFKRVDELLDHNRTTHARLGVCEDEYIGEVLVSVGCGLDRDVVLDMIREGRKSVNYDLSANLLGVCSRCRDSIRIHLAAGEVAA